ncbi:hypothetical protein, partial [Pararcticibacter amylolyticus]|uniref:hypothetical protein n=1 Tax=Pararcticibacter amylolyticus TaxID=2173175 RepID=UPI001EE45121
KNREINTRGELTPEQELAKYGRITSASNVSIGASLVFGGIVEYGIVMTDKNWAQRYMTVYYAHGFNPPSIAGGAVYVSSQNAVFSDWKGAMGGVSGSIGFVSGSVGFAPTYTAYGFAASYGRPLSLVKEFSNSGTFNIGVTTLIGTPFLMKANLSDSYIKKQTYGGGN